MNAPGGKRGGRSKTFTQASEPSASSSPSTTSHSGPFDAATDKLRIREKNEESSAPAGRWSYGRE
jgi:hypothetical protein